MSDRRLGVWFWLVVGLSSCVTNGLVSSPVAAQEEGGQSLVIGQLSLVEDQSQVTNDQGQVTDDAILQLSEIEQPATTVEDWIAQIEASLGEIPRDRYVSEPSDEGQYDALTLSYDFRHRFSDDWQIRNAFRFVDLNISRQAVFSLDLDPDGRTLNRAFQSPTLKKLFTISILMSQENSIQVQ